MKRLNEKYGKYIKAIGFSGHHRGLSIDNITIALGATWIERHFTFDRTSKDIGSRGGYALINSLDCDSVQNYVVWNLNNCFPNKETLEQNFAKAYLPLILDSCTAYLFWTKYKQPSL